MKLHLPVLLRKALLACFSFSFACSEVTSAADLTLGGDASLTIDYAAANSIPDLAGGTLQLSGDTVLLLSNCGVGDGKTYTLLTGVGALSDADGNPLTLTDENNAASLYFDTSRPGTGFWAGGWLQLAQDGSVQLVLHNETVKEAITITARQENTSAYQYYAGVSFENIEYAVGSSAKGGAIYGDNVTLSNNGIVDFNGNTAETASSSAYGGAIYGNVDISLSNNGRVTFSSNRASGYIYAYGGAIYGDSGNSIFLSNNGSVVFDGNTASSNSSNAYGGAIYGSTITLDNNESVTFSGNSASSFTGHYEARGGAIYGAVTMTGNGNIVFTGNTAIGTYSADAYGGAIYGSVTITGTGSVSFTQNTASSTYSFANGGAIYGRVTIMGTDSVSFIGNTASATDYFANGGAIYGNIMMTDNGDIMFSGNTTSSSSYCAYGGAIYGDAGSTITLSNNGSVALIGNRASLNNYTDRVYGGAIYTAGNLNIQNNDSVLFEKNAEENEETYRLRSIYAGGSGNVISLSASAEKNITFRDSIYIGSGCTVKLNAQYESKAQEGDIIFSGATTVNDLNSVKGNVAGTAMEIQLSRTSEINTLTELYGGRLRVEDGAIYQGRGITAMAGSNSTVRVKDASLNHVGYDLTFNAGTTLELAGNNIISGNVQMLDGSILSFDVSETTGVTKVDGNLTISGALSIACAGTLSGENAVLAYVTDSVTGWEVGNITILGSKYSIDDFTWAGNVLVLNYNAATFSPYFKEEITITTPQTGSVNYRDYNRVLFENIKEDALAYGGAIHGDSGSTITLSNNGSVEFIGNTFSSTTTSSTTTYTGAIRGDAGSTITLSNNGKVVFEGNTASSRTAYGGAIYGGSDSTITLSNNGSVEFIGNMTSSSSEYAYAGAIYGDAGSTITLSNNGSVEFIGNRASWRNSSDHVYGGAIYTVGNLCIHNNDSVLFEKNVVVSSGAYRLRSIYAGGKNRVISLSSAVGKSIEFRDSACIRSGSTVNLNQDYTYQAEDGTSVTIKQQGDIVFTGKYTEQHLNDLLQAAGAGRKATAEEILSSCATEVNAMTNLYGGRLCVEDGAIYLGHGATAMEGSAATVRVQNATLSHAGYDLTFNAGTTLELIGCNTITGNVQMLDGSTLMLNVQGTQGATEVVGNMNLAGGVALALSIDNDWRCENGVLMCVDGTLTGWDVEKLTVTGAGTYGTTDLSWVDNFLILNYNAETFNKYFKGTITYSANLSGYVGVMSYYERVQFENMSSSDNGPAIYGQPDCPIMLSNNGSVEFIGNTVSSSSPVSAGAIYGSVIMNDNEYITFTGNTASATTSSSSASASGGAMYGGAGCKITLCNNGSVTFIRNTASSSSASNHSASAYGGAIYGSTITLSDNESVVFEGNTASTSAYRSSVDAYGGAIYGGADSTITLSNNGSVIFEGNKASASSSTSSSGYVYGGAIYGGAITLSDNGSVQFIGNTACSSPAYSSDSYPVKGGAIYGGAITLSDNGSVQFIGNKTSSLSSAYGGAIYGSTITLSDNESVVFEGNTASSSFSAYGGAIYGGSSNTITLSNNGNMIFEGNTVSSSSSAYGGAIYTIDNLIIQNNDSVLFEKNAEISNGAYRLRSIYAGGRNRVISLSSAAGKSIEFRDSACIRSGSTVNLNQDYTYQAEDGTSVTIEQLGDIVFTGKYTVQHLNDLLEAAGAGRMATDEEVLNSRTTEVYAMTNLYGGRLRVEDGAIYQGQGITVHKGSLATVRVKDAELSHVGYDLTFNAGTALEVAGNSTIRGNVNLLADSLFKLEQAATLSLHETLQADAAELTVQGTALLAGSSTLNASLTLADGATLDMMSLDAGAVTINGALTFGGQVTLGEHLLAAVEELTCWEPGLVLFTGLTDLVLPVAASALESDRVLASSVFSNVEDSSLYVTYHVVDNVGSLMVMSVPEPTTTSLSLAALVALAMRRRRR